VGDRVAYAPVPGSYSEIRIILAERLILIPPSIDDKTAAAMMLQGMTAQYLLRQIHRVGPQDVVLVHAAAGGMGLILCQWAKSLGALVLGTVSTDEKAALARQNGCDYPIIYGREDVVSKVRKITEGAMATVVFDAVVVASPEVAKALRLRNGAKVTYLERLRTINGVPSFDIRYMPFVCMSASRRKKSRG
jgi:NADPH2:quinone reductase